MCTRIRIFVKPHTVEPRYNKSRYKEDLGTGVTNDFIYPNNSKIYEEEQDVAHKFGQ